MQGPAHDPAGQESNLPPALHTRPTPGLGEVAVHGPLTGPVGGSDGAMGQRFGVAH